MNYDVVIPAYNAAKTIKETLSSVLEQSVQPANIIVVDDGSTDSTTDLIRSVSNKIQVISQKNRGCGSATSTGIRATAAPVVATLDADDLWLPLKIERQLSVLKNQPDIALVFCHQRQFRHGLTDDGSGEFRSGLNRTSMVMRRNVFEVVGDIIDPPGNRGDMVDWLARARESGFGFLELPEVLALRRIIPGSLSYGRDSDKDKGYLEIAFRAMQRRRASQTGTDK